MMLKVVLAVALLLECQGSPIAGAAQKSAFPMAETDDTAVVLPEAGEELSEDDSAIDLVQSKKASSVLQDTIALQKAIAGFDPNAKDGIKRSREPAVEIPSQLKFESKMTKVEAESLDGRTDMRAKKCDPLDGDCDSFQLGDTEPWPIGPTKVHMNAPAVSAMQGSAPSVVMKEQPSGTRDVLDHADADAGGVAYFPVDSSPSINPVEINANLRAQELPKPTADEVRKSKCSKFLNGHDVPDALRMLDDDCGMPEPVIPCETAGNSTNCVPRIQLLPPAIPQAELMPPIPPAPYNPPDRAALTNVSVEIVDMGLSRTVEISKEYRVGQAIELAGAPWEIKAWMVQLVRSGGVDVPVESRIDFIPDKGQLVVYLRCVKRKYYSQLIMPLIACEDLEVRNFTAKVEVPANYSVFTVPAFSTDLVGNVLQRTEINLDDIEQVTYDGQNVTLDTPLERIYFRDGSAFVVYPKFPCASVTPSPSITPSPSRAPESPSTSPSPSSSAFPGKKKLRKLGAYDAFRHCSNARGDKIQLPDPASLGLDPTAVDPNGRAGNADVECEGSEMTVEEEPDLSNVGAVRPELPAEPANNTLPREPMTKRAIIQVVFEGRKIPVLIKPVARGIDIFDAVERATGKPHKDMIAKFMENFINHYTPLKPLGFIDGDVVEVVSMVRGPKNRAK